MALRRLLSGWLIALAALARSVAQVLERASEDRSAPPPDPVMAALAERYPGAPAHWLAHVAERTSQLADVGDAPLSLNSDPTAWPPTRPDGLAPLSTPAAAPEPAPRDLRRPTPRRDTAVPTLAALRDRSSEVWRRPDAERPRRPRPVFATIQPGSTSERGGAATPELGAPPRRPRSPLTFVGSPIQAASNASEPSTPGSDAPTVRASPHEAAWSKASPSHLATPDTTKAWHDARRSTDRPAIDHAVAQTHPTEDRPEAVSDQINATPAVHRQRSWFSAKSPLGRLERALERSTDPGRRSRSDRTDADGATASDPAPGPRAAVSFSTSDHQAAAPDRAWQAQTPPASRRSIFRALAALRAKPRPRSDPFQVSEPTLARKATTIDRPAPRSGREHPALTFTPSRATPSMRTTPAFSPIERDAPQRPTERHEPSLAAHRAVRRASNMPTSASEIQVQGKRATFTARPRTASRPVPRGFVLPRDDRWPALPPTTLASPHGVEAPPPRLEDLAREQEEGRWSV